MKHSPLHTDFHLALVSFLLQTKQNILSVAAEFDITSGQAFSLLLMDPTKPRSMKSYCKMYSCDAGNLTGIIDGLEEKRLVTREQDSTDRRIKVLRMLPAGVKLQKQLLARLAQESSSLVEVLDGDEQANFARYIIKIHRAIHLSALE